MSSPLELLAAAAAMADGAGSSGFDCEMRPWWEVASAFTVVGAVALPFSLLFVWLLSIVKLDRWSLATALFATVAAILTLGTLELIGFNAYLAAYWLAEIAGIHAGVEVLTPSIVVGFVGAIIFSWWLTHRHKSSVTIA